MNKTNRINKITTVYPKWFTAKELKSPKQQIYKLFGIYLLTTKKKREDIIRGILSEQGFYAPRDTWYEYLADKKKRIEKLNPDLTYISYNHKTYRKFFYDRRRKRKKIVNYVEKFEKKNKILTLQELCMLNMKCKEFAMLRNTSIYEQFYERFKEIKKYQKMKEVYTLNKKSEMIYRENEQGKWDREKRHTISLQAAMIANFIKIKKEEQTVLHKRKMFEEVISQIPKAYKRMQIRKKLKLDKKFIIDSNFEKLKLKMKLK